MRAILLSAMLALPNPAVVCLRYDALAYSEVWGNDCTSLRFAQIGGLDWVEQNTDCGTFRELRWQWWRIIDRPAMVPCKVRGEYLVVWWDKRTKTHYRVTAPVLHVWRTIRDPEVDDRAEFAESQRRGLK